MKQRRADNKAQRKSLVGEIAINDDSAVVDGNRSNQRRFVTKKLRKLHRLHPTAFDECFVQPALQYFLATLCDVRVEADNRSRVGLRYADTPEVRTLLGRLQRQKPVNADDYAAHPNAIIAALKEILSNFPGGIFVDVSSEFYSISLESPLDITIVYLHGLLETLPYFLRQFVYLICRSLRNLVQQSSGSRTDAYTDLLLLFTPALFPSSVGDVACFLRAARLTLVMVDGCEQVFQPVVRCDEHTANAWKPLSEDEAFFYKILSSLQKLEATLSEEETSNSSDDDRTDTEQEQTLSSVESSPNRHFYRFAYVE